MERETIELDFKIELKEYRRLLFKVTYQNPLLIFLAFIGIASIVIALGHLSGMDFKTDWNPWIQLLLGIFFAFGIPISIYFNSTKAYRNNPYLNENLNFKIDNYKIHVRGESFYNEYDWKNIYKIVKLKDWIVIYMNKVIIQPIPITAFQSESDLIKFKEYSKLHSRSVESSSSLFINKIIGGIKFFMSLMIISFAVSMMLMPDNQSDDDFTSKLLINVLVIVLGGLYLYYLVKTGYADFNNKSFKKGIFLIIGLIIHFILIFAAIFTFFQSEDMHGMLSTMLIMIGLALFIGIRDVIKLRAAYN